MGMLIVGAVVGLVIIAFLGFVVGLLEKIIGKRNTNLLFGLLSLFGGVLISFTLIDFISHSTYLYNSIGTFEIIFYGIFGLIAILSFYTSYNQIILNQSFESPTLLIASIFGLYISLLITQNLNTEIKPKEYKNMNIIYENIKTNSEAKKLYEAIFPEITKDNIVKRREYRKITRIEKYFNYLNQQTISKQQIINETSQKQNYLQEAKQKYLIEKSTN